jgi:phosphatidylglycerol:prolipoprotein diacylglycerol transferase
MYPVLFEFGPFELRFYAVMYVTAFLVGVWLFRKETLRLKMGLTMENVSNYSAATFALAIAGGRLYFVAFNLPYFIRNPLKIPAIWEGGLAFHGGIIAAVLFSLWYARKRGIPFFRLCDAVAPGLILGQAFARIGNFMNGETHGVPTTMPWGIVFPEGSAAGNQFPGTPVHPTMLYQLLLNVATFAVLWKLRKRPHRDGFIFACYLLLYGVARFVVSSFRADSMMVGGFRESHLITIFMIVAGGLWMVLGRLWRPDKS